MTQQGHSPGYLRGVFPAADNNSSKVAAWRLPAR